MTTTQTATDRQISYLVSLANRRYSQVRNQLGLSSSKCSRGLSKSEASAIIDQLLAEIG